MAHISITHFAGLVPEIGARLKPVTNAQIAHNCLLTDGSLRPQPKWTTVRQWVSASHNAYSIVYDAETDTVNPYRQRDAIQLDAEPFTPRIVVGIDDDSREPPEPSILMWCQVGSFNSRRRSGMSSFVDGAVGYTRSYDSIKPVNRMYAGTRVRKINGRSEESTLSLIGAQQPTDILYEGDLVNITFEATNGYLDGATHVRLYRTVSGLDTGENVTNELDTEWHLVAEVPLMPSMQYIDGESATAVPLDVCYSQNFHAPAISPTFFGITEGGWMMMADEKGNIQVSERFMHHAWPIDNQLLLHGAVITATATYEDNIFVGTDGEPYIISVSIGEAGTQLSAKEYAEFLPCLPNSMAPALGGVLYASKQGIVSLSREGQRVLSRDIANAGDVLFKKKYLHWVEKPFEGLVNEETSVEVSIGKTGFGTYYQGKYYGFMLDIPKPVAGGY